MTLLILAAAIPVCLFAGWVAYVTGQEERASARRIAVAAVTRVAERVTSELSSKIEVLETLAASGALDGPDLPMFYQEASRLKTRQPLWETVELTGLDGRQLLNLLRPFGTQLPVTADRESLHQVLQTRQPVIGGIGPVGPLSGKRLISLRVPVLRDGQLRYVLTSALVPDAVSSILREAGAPDGWVGTIVDRTGNVVARTIAEEFELGRPASAPLREAIARAPEGYYVGRTLEGVEVETVYRTLPRTGGWSVHLGVPTQMLNEPVRRSTFVLVSGGLLSLALAAGLALLTARDIAQRRNDEALRSAVALRISEERGAVAVEAAELGTWRWLVDVDTVCGSERSRTLLDLPRGAREGAEWCWPRESILAAIHPDDRIMVHDAMQRCLRDGSLLDIEFRAQLQSGRTRWLRATGRASSITAAQRDPLHGVIADIEPRKREEAERGDLQRRLAQAQEEDRRRIARELHDQVGQSVTGLSLGLKSLETTLPTTGANAVLQRLHWLQALTSEIGRDIHRAALALRPTALDDLGLYGALRTYVEDWSERFGIATDVQILGGKDRLPPEIESSIYRIVQEALTNVLKHAHARNVSVLVERKDSQLRLIIEDDGRGLDPDAERERSNDRPRLGLSGIRERLALIGGTMTIESAPGSGTTLFIQVPLGNGYPGLAP